MWRTLGSWLAMTGSLLGGLPSEDLQIAAAASLNFVLPLLKRAYYEQMETELRISFGSSGALYAQITNGAPFDVFLSADRYYPEELEKAGLIEPASLTRYAQGGLVLWSRNDSGVDVERGFSVLLEAPVQRLAIANPAVAPYGKAALEALQGGGMLEAIREKLVKGENVSQAAQFVESGAAEAGIIAESFVLAPVLKDRGRFWTVPDHLHGPLDQVGVILVTARAAGRTERARGFLNWLIQPSAQKILRDYGFRTISEEEKP